VGVGVGVGVVAGLDEEDGGGDDDAECDGFGEDDGGEENLEVGDGEPECFRPAGPDFPGCGARPPAPDLRGAFEPGRFGPDPFE
jgi:hypothetical protein